MTNEQIDQAFVDEAFRRWRAEDGARSSIFIAAQLAREGWTPPPQPVDPDVLVVREVLAGYWGGFGAADEYRKGLKDERSAFQSALSAYRTAKGDA